MIRYLLVFALMPLHAFAGPVFSETMIYAAGLSAPVPPDFHSITIEEAEAVLQNAANGNCSGTTAILVGEWKPWTENRMSYGRQIDHLDANFTCP